LRKSIRPPRDSDLESNVDDPPDSLDLSRELLSGVKRTLTPQAETRRHSRRATAKSQSPESDPLIAMNTTASGAAMNGMGQAVQATPQSYASMLAKEQEHQLQQAAAQLVANSVNERTISAASGSNDTPMSDSPPKYVPQFSAATEMILKRINSGVTGSSSSPAATTIGKRRGRPSKAEIERRQRDAMERGDVRPPTIVSWSQTGSFRKDDSRTETLTFARDIVPKPSNPDIGSTVLMIPSSPAATTIQKKRGRPSKADMERKQREAIEPGDILPPAPVSQSQAGPSRQDDSETETIPLGRDIFRKPVSGSLTSTISSSPAATTTRKRRGRASKADMERNQSEAIERGDNHIVP
jgi:hypothetical protein